MSQFLLKIQQHVYINEYFLNIGPNLARNMNTPWDYNGITKPQLFDIKPATMEEIQPIIRNIKTHKDSGVPHISTHVLKDALTELPLHLLHVINLSITRNEFPDSWKTAQSPHYQKEGTPLK